MSGASIKIGLYCGGGYGQRVPRVSSESSNTTIWPYVTQILHMTDLPAYYSICKIDSFESQKPIYNRKKNPEWSISESQICCSKRNIDYPLWVFPAHMGFMHNSLWDLLSFLKLTGVIYLFSVHQQSHSCLLLRRSSVWHEGWGETDLALVMQTTKRESHRPEWEPSRPHMQPQWATEAVPNLTYRVHHPEFQR